MDGAGIFTHGTADELSLVLSRIPAGSFVMGCEVGQDNEKPIHRVWIDEFQLAAHQVTNADYARYVEATRTVAPPFWGDPALNHAERPVVGVAWYEARLYCDWLGAEAAKRRCSRGAICHHRHFPDMPSAARVIGRVVRSRWAAGMPTDMGSTICAITCTSGAATGTRPIDR